MKIENKITTAVINTLQALYGITPDTSTVQLQKTKKEFEGHLTLVVFPFLKASRKNPEATATEIGEYLVKNESAVASYKASKDTYLRYIRVGYNATVPRTYREHR